MLSFLGFGGKKPAKKPVRKSAANNNKKQIAENKKPQAPSTPKLQADNKISIVDSFEDLPTITSVKSLKEKEFQLASQLAENFLICTGESAKDLIVVVRTADNYQASDSRRDFIAVKNVIKNAEGEFGIQKLYVSSAVFHAVHDKFDSDLDDVSKSELTELFDKIVTTGVNKGASDIHLEIYPIIAKVRMRIHGSVVEIKEHSLESDKAKKMAFVIYTVLCSEKEPTFNPLRPQSGMVSREINGQPTRMRLEVVPTSQNGYELIFRILENDDSIKDIKQIGFSAEHLADLQMANKRPVGVILTVGVTGSGKSTTNTALVGQRVTESEGKDKIIFIEEPIEREMPGVTQVNINRNQYEGTDIDPFTESIRSAMRADPDVIGVGEVRDKTTANLLVKAVFSGHPAYATLHAPSSLSAVTRLRDLGVPNSVLGNHDFISAIIFQTLLPVVCEHCCMSLDEYLDTAKETPQMTALFKRISKVAGDRDITKIRFKNEKGCPHCVEGVGGRTVTGEVLIPDHVILQHFTRGEDLLAKKHFQKNGGRTALDHGIHKMLQGVADPKDVETKLGLLTAEIIMDDGVMDYSNEREDAGFIEKGQEEIAAPYRIEEETEDTMHLGDLTDLDMSAQDSDVEDNGVDINSVEMESELFGNNEKSKTADVVTLELPTTSNSDSAGQE
ncbi:GspE/PulE family protein [Neptuniibacter sp. QD37_11]|uniref:GspE/PulE family protein n=1 Tax=Neptuniibacter sp. QD37_11 TaxID=3398209 RepID=UPI0039F512D2